MGRTTTTTTALQAAHVARCPGECHGQCQRDLRMNMGRLAGRRCSSRRQKDLTRARETTPQWEHCMKHIAIVASGCCWWHGLATLHLSESNCRAGLPLMLLHPVPIYPLLCLSLSLFSCCCCRVLWLAWAVCHIYGFACAHKQHYLPPTLPPPLYCCHKLVSHTSIFTTHTQTVSLLEYINACAHTEQS